MATATAIDPSADKAYHLKWLSLLVDGGTLVLKDQFDQRIPPNSLQKTLKRSGNFKKISILINKKVINKQQQLQLYPKNNITPDSTTFDVSLLACLLRSICGLKNEKDPVWTSMPTVTDLSVEADIYRLRTLRNEISHPTSATTMTYLDFMNKWNDLEQILLRLGSSVVDLKKHIDVLKNKSIDPDMETQFEQRIDIWEEIDKLYKEQIQEVKDKIDATSTELKEHETQLQDVNKRIRNVETNEETAKHERTTLQQNVLDIENSVKGIQDKHDDMDKRLNIEKEYRLKQEGQMSSKFKSLSAVSKDYFEDASKDVFVKTKAFHEAKTRLLENNVIVISGQPGEGKTSMAKQLAMEVSSMDKCLRLRSASDWKHVDISLNLFDTIFIDDIFGASVLKEKMLNEWENHLSDISKVAKNKKLFVIITTRHYILEDAREKLEQLGLFKNENVIVLSSENLDDIERAEILEAHLLKNDKKYDNSFILICVLHSKSFISLVLGHGNTFLFGFPECVNMFVSNDALFERGPLFFEKPNEFFKSCIEGLFKDEDKFFALAIIWARKNQSLRIADLDISSTSHELKKIAKKFGFKLKAKLVKKLRQSLKHQRNGLLDFESKTGTYRFNHTVISDMIGLVLGKHYPKETLEMSSTDFIMEYVSIDSTEEDEFHIYVEEYMYDTLNIKLIDMLFNTTDEYETDEFATALIGRGELRLYNPYDYTVFLHSVFKNKQFVKGFVQHLLKTESIDKAVFSLMVSFRGKLFSYDIGITSKFYLPDMSLMMGNEEFFVELMDRKLLQSKANRTEVYDLSLALLIAVRYGHANTVRCILETDCEVTDDAIYIAAHLEYIDILNMLLKYRKDKSVLTSNIGNKNNALIASAKKGFTKSVKCLVENGYDLEMRNSNKMSALDQAVLNKHKEICRILLDHGAKPNVKSGKFKRTPLHVASDTGQPEIVEMLLQKGANVRIKDHRGHCPIHCATFAGNADVVRCLLLHDATQANIKITSYGSKSFIKGMAIPHIAVQKDYGQLFDIFLELRIDINKVDHYGRTAVYCAVYAGKIDMVKKILNEADLDKPEKNGYTPLHAALFKGHDTISLLLMPLVNVNATDKFGKTPCHVASEMANLELLIVLAREFNADFRAKTNRGDNIFHILYRRYGVRDETYLTNNAADKMMQRLFLKWSRENENKIENIFYVDCNNKDEKWNKCLIALQDLDKQFVNDLKYLPNKYGEINTVRNLSETVVDADVTSGDQHSDNEPVTCSIAHGALANDENKTTELGTKKEDIFDGVAT